MYLYDTPYKLFSSPSRSLELFRVNSTMVKKSMQDQQRQMTDNSDEVGKQILPSRNKNYVRFEALSSRYNHFLKHIRHGFIP